MTPYSESLSTQETTKLDILQENFCRIFDTTKQPEAVELFKKIAEKYQAKTRAYHNFDHLEKMLSFLKEHEQEIRDLIGIKLAVWLHDVVYDAMAKDNEEQSARYAQNYLEQLGVSEKLVGHVAALIRATAKHEIIDNDPDSAIFLDGDLAILGSSEEEYDKYAAKIRQEYAWMPDDDYKAGRIKMLKSFLKKPRIFFTERANKELEQQARRNIKREIEKLS